MKAKIISIGLALAVASVARADFNPVPIKPGAYNFSIVVPSNTVQAVPYCLTADTETGAALEGTSFYEQGFYAQPGQPDSYYGIPPHNTVFTDINNPGIQFLMPPDYTTNNDLQIDASHGSGTLAFGTPTAATNLAILACAGTIDNLFAYTVNHTDGSLADSGYVFVPEWFAGGAGTNSNFNGAKTTHSVAWGADDRIVTGCEFGCGDLGNFYDYGGDGGNYNNNNPYLYSLNIPISDSSPITGISFGWYDYNGGSEGNFYAVSGNNSGTNWTPIPVGGFNQITTVAATVPYPVTATMDSGTNLDSPGNTWFEQGYYQGDISDGLPPSGSTFTSVTQPTHQFQMGNYSSNNAILIDANHLSTEITPVNPGHYSTVTFLTAGGNIGTGNEMTNSCIVQHADGVNETNQFIGYDWLDSTFPGAIAWAANGRVDLNNRTLNDLNATNGAPYLFETSVALSDTNSLVTNILVQYGTAPADNSATYVMAVSANILFSAPVFSGLTNPVTTYGDAFTLRGRVGAPGPLYPANGETIAISIGGNTRTTTIDDSTGDFTLDYGSTSIPATNTAYTVTYSYAGNDILAGVTNIATTLTVNPAPLTITASPQIITYGTTVPTTTVTYAGFVNGETNTALSSQPTVILGLTGLLPVGLYSLNYTPSGAVDGNYNISYYSSDLTVNPAPLTIRALAQTITYGATVPATTVTYTGFVNGETNTALSAQPGILSGQSGVAAAGTYTGNYAASGAADSNYQINYVNGTLTVNRLVAVLTGTNTYNGTTNATGTNLVVSNVVGSDDVRVASGTAGMASADIGTNAITSFGELVLGGTTASNYSLIGSSGFVIVPPLPVTLTGAREFDGTATAAASILTIATNYDGANLTLSGSAVLAAADVGTEGISSFSGLTLGGSAANNYTLTGASGSVTITSESITVVDGLVLATNGFGTINYAALPGSLVTGKKYTITAVPDSQNLFACWLGGSNEPYSVLGTSAKYTFTMEPNLVLVANFVTNIFVPGGGVYNGLFITTNGVSQQTAGMLRGLTIAQKGTYSGTLLLNGQSHAVNGVFDLAGQATNRVSRPASQGGPVVVAMTLLWDQSPPQVTGTVSGTEDGVPWEANLLADQATNTLPAAEFTMLIPPDTNNAPPLLSPGGAGYALITNYTGTAGNPGSAAVRITGALADGAAFRQSVPVSQDGYVPIYANLYSSKGLLLGWINLSLTNTAGVSLTWIHPGTRSGSYQKGFTNILVTDQILVSQWTDPAANLDSLTNFSMPGTINDPPVQNVAVTTTAEGNVTGPSVSGTINPATGLLTVTVGRGADRVTGYGAVLLNSTNGGGYFLTKTNAQAIQLGQ